jgi:hypothetical protein
VGIVAQRLAVVVVLANFVLGPLAPLALVFAEQRGPLCCRGRCCCSGDQLTTGACFRSACHCGHETPAPLPAAPRTDAVLPRPLLPPTTLLIATLAPAPAAQAKAEALPLPDPPPWRLVSHPSAV